MTLGTIPDISAIFFMLRKVHGVAMQLFNNSALFWLVRSYTEWQCRPHYALVRFLRTHTLSIVYTMHLVGNAHTHMLGTFLLQELSPVLMQLNVHCVALLNGINDTGGDGCARLFAERHKPVCVCVRV